ncbi:hypothetical protein Syun_028635 [Stephania yunnanensis]|uniref:Uncharacterized protein n=1 Tax=Stephania yunnanensis TaxID=152371 RepID=A0AAP0E464_9MAGN
MALVTEEVRAKAEIYYGAETCEEKANDLLKEMEMPNGLLPLDNLEECGYDKESGLFWFIRKERKEIFFEGSGRLVSYEVMVTGYIEKGKIKKVSGIKSKEFGFWVPVREVYVHDSKITFKGPAGVSRTLPISAMERTS